MATKYLDYAGFEHFVSKLKTTGVGGKVMSDNNLTDELMGYITEMHALLAADSDGVINKFNEIVAFLEGIGNADGDKDLEALLAEIASNIGKAQAAADKAQSELDAHKTAYNTYTTANDKAVQKAQTTADKANTDLSAYKTEQATAKASDDAALATYKEQTATSIADAKKAGTDASAALSAYKAEHDEEYAQFKSDNTAAIADAKKAGTDAAAALSAYKTANDKKVSDYITSNDAALAADKKDLSDYKTSNNKALSDHIAEFNQYKTDNDAALANIQTISEEEIDALLTA